MTTENQNAPISWEEIQKARETKKRLAENWQNLVNVFYNETPDNNPKTTIKNLISKIGFENALEIVAVAINIKSYDGRISKRNADYFAIVTDIGKDNDYYFNIDKIHPAHLDQIADTMRNTEKPTTPPETTETETTETETPKKKHRKTKKEKAREQNPDYLNICENPTGKMQEIRSISTSPLLNPICMERAKDPDCICHYCFSQKQLAFYQNQAVNLAENTEILNAHEIPPENLPIINALYFRFEAFGDLSSVTQTINYFNICKKNPLTRFALWTKNPVFIKKAIEQGHQKPENLNIIFSSYMLNNCNFSILEKMPFLDKVFTVYDPDFIQKNAVYINCGAKKCLTCLKCYTKNNERFIAEKLK